MPVRSYRNSQQRGRDRRALSGAISTYLLRSTTLALVAVSVFHFFGPVDTLSVPTIIVMSFGFLVAPLVYDLRKVQQGRSVDER